MTKACPFIFLLAALLAACGAGNPAGGAPGAAPHPHGDDHHDAGHDESAHEHAERIPLGEVTLGEHTIAVYQVAAVEPGKEGDFDLDFPAGKALPEAVRGWIGLASAQGSLRMRFEKETAARLHGHPEAPEPMPEGSALWLEVDGATGPIRQSIAFRR